MIISNASLFVEQVSTMLTITDILPSTKTIASIKLPDYKSGKVLTFLSLWSAHEFTIITATDSHLYILQLEVQYLHEHASFTTAVGLNGSPAVDVSATLGTPSIAFGAEASYLTSSRVFAKYNAGVSLTKQNSSASVIL